MPDTLHTGVESKAAIRRHPLHPMLVPFPIAYLAGALATDIAYLSTADPFWARGSLWLVGAGLMMGILAAGLGFTDFLARREIRAHRTAWKHLIGNAIVLALAFVSMLLRVADAEAAVMPEGLVLSVVIVVILGFTGWLGGELSYRHRIGMMETNGQQNPQQVKYLDQDRRMGPPDRRLHA